MNNQFNFITGKTNIQKFKELALSLLTFGVSLIAVILLGLILWAVMK